MASHESRLAIYTSIGANVVIAVVKFVAAVLSHSSAMLAEGIHSLVDASDGSLLLLGQHRSRRPPDELHPFGHGKELYFWTLIVALVFFAIGGGVSVYEGVLHLVHPEALRDPTWSYVVLGVALLFDGTSFTVAFRQFRKEAAGAPIWSAIRESKDPSVFTVLLEDTADLAGIALAFLGIFLGHTLGNVYLDGVATIGVGLVLAVVALVLVRESKALLIGEGAQGVVLARIRSIAARDPAVRAVRRPLTMYFGPDEMLLGMGIEFDPSLSAAEVATAIDRLERNFREEMPVVRHIYIEAESLTGSGDARLATRASPLPASSSAARSTPAGTRGDSGTGAADRT